MFAEGVFDGRVALVTGAGRGIGEAVALGLADLGADVAVNDIDGDTAEETAAAVEARGRNATVVLGDVSDQDVARGMVAEAESELGLVRHVVNNAGSNNDDDLVDLPYDEWRHTMGVNLDGTFLVSREAARRLIDRDERGSFVNLSSITGLGPQPGAGAYSPSKGAIIMLTRQMAMEWAEDGIRVNAIAPGLIWTPATDPVYSDDDLFAARRDWVPMKQIGEPQDVVRAAIYLLAPENRYTTGETLLVDGGASNVGLNLIPGRAQHE